MLKIKILIPVLLFITMLNVSCLRHKIEGSYNVTTVERSSEPFTQLTSEGDYDVYYSYAPDYSVVIEAEDNLIPYVETSVHGNDLVVKTEKYKHFENHFPIKVYVQSPFINEVILSGSGQVNIDSTSCDDFNMVLSGSGNINAEVYANNTASKISGSGNVYLTGQTHQSDLKISGSGELDAYEFYQDECSSEISGSGNMKIFVYDILNAHISGSGKIYYRGNPVVNTNITGSGKVIHQY